MATGARKKDKKTSRANCELRDLRYWFYSDERRSVIIYNGLTVFMYLGVKMR